MTREGEGAPEQRPIVSDRRRIDPETFELRDAAARSATQSRPAAPGQAGDAGQPGEETQPGEPGGTASNEELAAAKAEAADLADQLARRNADLYNVQQQYNAYVRRAKAAAADGRESGVFEVVEALLGVLDEIELARQHGDLTGTFEKVAEKLEQVLTQRFGVARFAEVGEEFDPQLHEALMHTPDGEAEIATVSQVMQPGYKVGDRILRAARVAVRGPQ